MGKNIVIYLRRKKPMFMSGMQTVCFLASSGGHFTQLLMMKPLMDKYNSFIVTEQVDSTTNASYPCPIHFLHQMNRKEWNFPFLFILNTLISLRIFLTEKPDVIVSTGVLATIPMCCIAKICHKKVIYIESFAKVHSGTLTGRLMKHIADTFFVQWKSMLDVYPNAIYAGGGLY